MFKKMFGVSAVSLLAAKNAMAAVPATVSDAITTAGTDGATVAGLVLVAVVGIFAFVLMRKGLR
jgi:hypothetical protein